MKHLKLYKIFESKTASYIAHVAKVCKEYRIQNYTINENGTVDVDGDVFLYTFGQLTTELPLNFGKVSGNFTCSNNQLTSLKGSPQFIGGSFYCANNKLTSLEGGPKEVGGHYDVSENNITSLKGVPEKLYNFDCSTNRLTSLEFCPTTITGNLDISNNMITSLKGAPSEVGDDFYCEKNRLTSLEFCPDFTKSFYCYTNQLESLEGGPNEVTEINCMDNNIITLEGCPTITGSRFDCSDNPIYEIVKYFTDRKEGDRDVWVELFNYYDIVRDDTVILPRLKYFYEEAGIDIKSDFYTFDEILDDIKEYYTIIE